MIYQIQIQRKQDHRFDFLEKTHPYNSYFESLIKMYSQIIHPKKDYIDFITKRFADQKKLLTYCKAKCEYLQKEELDEEKKLKRKEFLVSLDRSIDWNDFVIVETIDF